MTRPCIALVVAVGLLVAACASPAPPPASGAALFDALGGKPGIALLMDDFVARLAIDPRIGSFFRKTDLADLKKQLADQFCVVAGGPCAYDGATMKKSHADLSITKADFNRLVELLQLSMNDRGIGFADQNRLLARLAPMHRDIVNER